MFCETVVQNKTNNEYKNSSSRHIWWQYWIDESDILNYTENLSIESWMEQYLYTVKWEIFAQIFMEFQGKSRAPKIEIREIFSKFDQLCIYLYTDQ